MNDSRAIYLTRDDTGQTHGELRQLDDATMQAHAAGGVDVALSWSGINYKDALAITGKAPVVRQWPMVPGIDGAGIVTRSDDPRFKPGDAVLLNGWGVGEAHWGCLATRAGLRGDWLMPLPAGLSAREAMAIGTAGYTAMLCALAIREHGLQPGDGDVLVTGASGGVGSVAIAILAGWGYRVIASTGRLGEAAYLQGLGAAEIIDRASLSMPGKPLQRERYAAVVDAVGSHTLANACAQTRYDGIVTACGLAQGMDLPASVAPFILRGVTLRGIDSVQCPMPRRQSAWAALASDLDRARLTAMTREVSLAEAIPIATELLQGSVRGRVVVDVNRDAPTSTVRTA